MENRKIYIVLGEHFTGSVHVHSVSSTREKAITNRIEAKARYMNTRIQAAVIDKET